MKKNIGTERNTRTKGKMAMNKYLSIITLNVNESKAPIKTKVAEWIRKHDPYICCLQRTTSEQKTYTD